MTDLTPIIEGIITLIFALITTFLIPFLKSKLSNSQLDEVKKWVKIAVEAAEMLYTKSGVGPTKKKYVTDFLTSKGFKLDADEIENLIESAVLEMKATNEQ